MTMKFRELSIETQRQAPSHARTPGFAFLVRAGYLTRDHQPTQLGQYTLAHLQRLSQVEPTRFFERLGLPVIKANSEVFFAIPTGDYEILQCPSCQYAARRETASFKKHALPTERPLPLEKVPTPDCNTIESLADFLGVSKEKTAKALMFTRLSDSKFVFVAVRGDMQLSEAKLKKHIGEFRLATPEEISDAGAAAGYASPIGLKDALIVVDDLIPQSANLVAGANQAGYHLKNTNYGRDYSAEIVADIVMAGAGDACPNCGNALTSFNSELLADETGYRFESLLAALAEVHHDDKGLTFPKGVAPFDVYLMYVPGKETDTRAKAEEIYAGLQNAGITVLFDDRDERAGVKFNDADLIGCPVRVTAGERNLREGMVELKARKEKENRLISLTSLSSLTSRADLWALMTS
jgi:prolyl-tRNA synthetase